MMERCKDCMYYWKGFCYRRGCKCHHFENVCDEFRYRDCCCDHFGAVFYNPYNKVIQCHVCGEVHDWLGKEELRK